MEKKKQKQLLTVIIVNGILVEILSFRNNGYFAQKPRCEKPSI